MAAEAEGVVERDTDFLLPGGVGDVVEVALGVGIVEIDGGRGYRIADGEGADGGLDGAGGTEEVAGHGLTGTDKEAVLCVSAKEGLYRLGLADVADAGRGAVRVDVIDFVGVDAAFIEGHFHAADGSFALGEGGGHVIGIGTEAVAGDLAVNGCAAAFGVFEFLDEKDASAFAHDGYAHLVSEQRRALRIKGLRRDVSRGEGGVPPVLPP